MGIICSSGTLAPMSIPRMMPGRPFPYTRNSSCSGSGKRQGGSGGGQPEARSTRAFVGSQLRHRGWEEAATCPCTQQVCREHKAQEAADGLGQEGKGCLQLGRKELKSFACPWAHALPMVWHKCLCPPQSLCPPPAPAPPLAALQGRPGLTFAGFPVTAQAEPRAAPASSGLVAVPKEADI